MIAYFKFNNFLSINAEQTLSFEPALNASYNDAYLVEVKEGVDLLKVATIYGANASGKSNILLALSFFKDMMNTVPSGRSEEIEFYPFLLNDSSRNDKSNMEMTFYLKGERYKLSVEFDSSRIYSEKLEFYPSTKPALLYSRTYQAETDFTDIDFGAKLELSKESKRVITGNTTNNCSVLAAFDKSNIELSRLNIVYDFFSKKLTNIITPQTSISSYTKTKLANDKDGSLKEFIIRLLKASDFNISNIELEEESIQITEDMERFINIAPFPDEVRSEVLAKGTITNQELIFRHKTDNGEYTLPENLESNGTIRYMGLAVLLKELLRDNKVMFIDEIESSLHYEILLYFIKVFVANDSGTSQLIFTTHDINLLDEDYIRRDTVWFSHKNNCAETKLSRLSSMGLHKNLSPYNAYKQGKLVDLPFLESIYLNLDE